jgi:hypothetical protein
MFFMMLIVLLVWFQMKSGAIPAAELWFMLALFSGLAYVAGFLDSRLFARFDKQNRNLLAEAEARYEARYEATEPGSEPSP